jgi:hypothetical protein
VNSDVNGPVIMRGVGTPLVAVTDAPISDTDFAPPDAVTTPPDVAAAAPITVGVTVPPVTELVTKPPDVSALAPVSCGVIGASAEPPGKSTEKSVENGRFTFTVPPGKSTEKSTLNGAPADSASAEDRDREATSGLGPRPV